MNAIVITSGKIVDVLSEKEVRRENFEVRLLHAAHELVVNDLAGRLTLANIQGIRDSLRQMLTTLDCAERELFPMEAQPT